MIMTIFNKKNRHRPMSPRQAAEAERLMKRFFDGTTTVEEEQRLYEIFAAGNLPSQLEPYREMFRGFGSMRVERSKGKLCHDRKTWLKAAACAVLLAVMTAATWIFFDYRREQILAGHYAGSYVIENGRRIDDLSKIRPDIETALQKAGQIEHSVSEDIRWSDRIEQEVLDNIDDPKTREQVSKMLDN